MRGARRFFRPGARSLSGRLLLLTIAFVMLAEVLIFLPSVAYFRRDFLVERQEAAQLASLALAAAGDMGVSQELEWELLLRAGVLALSIQRDDRRERLMAGPIDRPITAAFDLRGVSLFRLIWDAFGCALAPDGRVIQVIGAPSNIDARGLASTPTRASVEIVMEEAPLKREMTAFAVRVFWLSMAISIITGTLMYIAVRSALVRPMRGVIDGIVSFREDPEDARRIIRLSGASGEIGVAERELAETQREVLNALRQKTRLASLGRAVAKINHDLRNILASAQLLTDRLETSTDPMVARIAPKLVGSLDRAIRLCQQTLEYGRADEPPPQMRRVGVAELIDEIAIALRLDPESAPPAAPRFENAAPRDLVVNADPDQLHRVILNLARNAAEAVGDGDRAGWIRVEARTKDGQVEIDVVDNGPGVAEQANAHLFQPFRGSLRRDGSGLGLAIADELVRGHGGSLRLEENGPAGARFRVSLPDRVDAST